MKTFDILKFVVPILDATITTEKGGITSARYLGTGFFISPEIIMTCGHVIANAQSTPCVAYTTSLSEEPAYYQVRESKIHPYADLALAWVGKIAEDFQTPFLIDTSTEIIPGKDIYNYSYVENFNEGSMVSVTPRVFKGYITRQSVDHRDKRLAYIEVNFPAMRGMSGSPIFDEQMRVLGVIYQNYRAELIEDYTEWYRISDGETTLAETTTVHKAYDFAKAVDLSKYYDFIAS